MTEPVRDYLARPAREQHPSLPSSRSQKRPIGERAEFQKPQTIKRRIMFPVVSGTPSARGAAERAGDAVNESVTYFGSGLLEIIFMRCLPAFTDVVAPGHPCVTTVSAKANVGALVSHLSSEDGNTTIISLKTKNLMCNNDGSEKSSWKTCVITQKSDGIHDWK